MPVHDWTKVIPGIFHHFHHDWISAISGELNRGLLPPDYYALAEQRASEFGPVVLALERKLPKHPNQERNGHPSSSGSTRGGIALASAPPKVRHTSQGSDAEWYAQKKKAIIIRHRSEDEVVALVEIVSFGKMTSRSALRDFVEKAVEFLRAGIHLLAIDLYPPTARDPQGIHKAIWDEIGDDDFVLPREKPLTLASYAAGSIPKGFIESVAVGDTLPDMPLFIEPDVYVLVPLESTYRSAYEAVPDRWKEELE